MAEKVICICAGKKKLTAGDLVRRARIKALRVTEVTSVQQLREIVKELLEEMQSLLP